VYKVPLVKRDGFPEVYILKTGRPDQGRGEYYGGNISGIDS